MDNRTRPHDQHYPTVTRNVLDRCRPLYSFDDPGCRSTLSARSGNRPLGMILLSIFARTRALFRMRGTHLHESIWLAYSWCRRRRGCSQMSTSMAMTQQALAIQSRRLRGKSQTELPKGATKIRWKDPRSSSGKPGAPLSLMQYRYTDLLRLHSLVPFCHEAALPNVSLGSGSSVGSGYWSVQLQSMPGLKKLCFQTLTSVQASATGTHGTSSAVIIRLALHTTLISVVPRIATWICSHTGY